MTRLHPRGVIVPFRAPVCEMPCTEAEFEQARAVLDAECDVGDREVKPQAHGTFWGVVGGALMWSAFVVWICLMV